MANKLNSLLKSVDSATIENVKQKLETGDFSQMLQQVDMKKAEQLVQNLNLQEQLKGVDITTLLNEVKKNPTILKNLKNLF